MPPRAGNVGLCSDKLVALLGGLLCGLELFLAETLDVPWDRVHDEAEILEHALSEELDRIEETVVTN
jgi:hypothetical protein